jgi:hypothetical protein
MTVSPSPEQLSELVTGLRDEAALEAKFSSVILDCRQDRRWQAADALQSAQAEIARLTTALEPFAKFNISGFDAAMEVVPPWAENPAKRIEPIYKEHFVRARAALKDSPNVG